MNKLQNHFLEQAFVALYPRASPWQQSIRYQTRLSIAIQPYNKLNRPYYSSFSSKAGLQSKDYKAGNMSTEPPRHEMVYLPSLLSETRSFGLFRKVIHTGLYSQLVAMEVPPNGEIGDEVSYRATYICVSFLFPFPPRVFNLNSSSRPNPK
jgi:hypothetical protein